MTAEANRKFLKYQWKFIICLMFAYVFFYLTWKNLSMLSR